jgi:hypothetical protein
MVPEPSRMVPVQRAVELRIGMMVNLADLTTGRGGTPKRVRAIHTADER